MIEEKEIVALAKLAKLKLDAEEIVALTQDMSEIVAFADKINASLLETAEAPKERVVQFCDLREDEVIESLPQDEILSTVDGGVRGFYEVRRKSHR